ncbi:MAG: hypothetical protein ABJJ39_08495 [Kangiellaceae bacterium]
MTAGELLEIFQTRLNMQAAGSTNPSDNIKQMTKSLVEQLSKIEDDQTIDVVVDKEKQITQYILNSTGKVLVEKRDGKSI